MITFLNKPYIFFIIRSHLVGSQSVLSDGRFSSRVSESTHANQRGHVFAKNDPAHSSALSSGFVYKPRHIDRLKGNNVNGRRDDGGRHNRAFAKNTLRSHKRFVRMLCALLQFPCKNAHTCNSLLAVATLRRHSTLVHVRNLTVMAMCRIMLF